MNVGSLFSGIGGLDLGLQHAGMHIAWHSEINQPAARVLEHHWPEVPNLGDITQIGPAHLRMASERRRGHVMEGQGQAVGGRSTPRRTNPDGESDAGGLLAPDVLCGGFPCQDLSVAGRRAGLSGQQSGLFYEFARLADELQPAWLIIENVPGLLSSNNGRDMGTLLNALADLGYADLSWRVVDSLNFGVPQRRRRLFIVGHLGTGTRTRQVLLEPEGRPWSPPQSRETRTAAADDAARSVAFRGRHGGSAAELGDEAAFTLRGSQGGGDKPYAMVSHALTGHGTRMDPNGQTFVASALTASAGHHGHSSPRGDGQDNIVPVAFHENQRAELTETSHAQALNHGGGKPGQSYPTVRVGARVRRLTPLECERLQGFPDNWTHPAGSDSARYRCLGNAVTVPVAHWIGQQIMAEERGQL